MHVEYAQLPPPEESADRIFITDNAVIVLDGATAFVPVPVSAQTYADHLGSSIVHQLHASPTLDLRDALAQAIRFTAADLGVNSSDSPSATVAVLRERAEEYDVLVLGDTAALWGAAGTARGLTDERLSRVASPHRERYRKRLRAGHGFDDLHRLALRALQTEQRKFQNVEGGYWIAAANPFAAYKALVTTVPRAQLTWAVIATDGAFNLLEHQGRNDWAQIAGYPSSQLGELLRRLHQWEAVQDPTGRLCPRAKLHDDKAIATLTTDLQT